MSDEEQLELLPADRGTAPASCSRCGREMLVSRAGLASAELAPLDAWIGVTAYVDVPEHRVLRAVVRRREGTGWARPDVAGLAGLELLCAIGCKGL